MSAICLNELSNYNNGTLVYKWFDLESFQSADEYEESVKEWLASVPHPYGGQCEEWCIGDIEDVPSPYYCDYNFDAAGFFEYKALRDEVGEEKLNAWLALFRTMPESAEALEERFFLYSEYKSDHWNGFFQEIGEQLVEENGLLESVPQVISNYFDYKQYGRDEYLNSMSMIDGFVFWNC